MLRMTIKLRIVEECVALGEHVVGAAEDALTERFLFESTELAGRARRHQRDVAVQTPSLIGARVLR